MKRRNADCGKIRRPIKKNKIAEQIGSNTLLYIKFLLLWASVITVDFLLEFRFEFLWPFWLLLRSIYDSFKYKGLAFSVLFVCIAVTSDLVCLFFIPVQWLFFAASTYVWVQYVWHTDKGICLPTIILWILFVYLEAAIRWKDSRNIPHLNLCRPFAAHCIGYPVVTLGFGFKSYVGYRIRQRKQREVAKDNDFYMQLLQEALPKEESRALEPLADGTAPSGTGGSEPPTTPKELVAVAMSNNNNSLNNSSSSTTNNRSDTGQHNHHNHHHHNHQQQQQHAHHTNHNKSTQSYKSSNSSSVTTAHVNGHIGGGSSPSSSSSTMNGGLNHSSHQQQGSSKHRKSLDKDSSTSSNSSSNSSSNFNAGSKMNGGSGGSGGTFYLSQTTTFQQCGNSGSSSSSNSSSSNSSNNGSTTISTKEISNTGNRGNDHNGSIHLNGGSVAKDSKESTVQALTTRKDYDKETNSSSSSAGSNSSSSSSSGKHGNGHLTASNRSKSPTDSGALGNKSNAGKQNGHILQYHQSELVQQVTVTEITTPSTESKGGSGRSGRKNRLKKAAEQANLSAIAKLCATIALASSVTTLTTTSTSSTSAGGGGKGTTITTSSYTTTAGTVSSASVKDNHQHNVEQVKDVGDASNGTTTSGSATECKPDSSVSSSASGTHKATSMATGSSGQGTSTVSSPQVATVIVQKLCETCPRLEGELKKLRAELSSHRQTENELRQKYDSNTNNLKACLQAKQKDYDELQNRYQEHCNQRQQERQNLQTVERRLGEERRHRQSLEAQLNNERKYRKQAEEKAARAECSEACKMKKQQMEMDIDKLQNELHILEEAKLIAEKQARNYEQELRKMELQLRNRDSQQNTEVLMSALAAMQDKNATLEKSLSAETRFKLDLFSALGGTRREVEILTCSLRDKEKEVLELNAKIVQLLAVMPSENLCLTSHGGGTGTDGASMMRLADAPQLLPQSMTSGHLNGIGQSSGGGGGGVSGAGGGAGGGGMSQQPSPMSHMVQNGPSFCSQLGSLGVLTSTMTTLPSSLVLSGPNSSNGNGSNGGQIVQMQNSNNGGPNTGNCPSGLDPNATIYTPKNNGMVGGTEA